MDARSGLGDQYPKQAESLPAFTNFLMAPETALKSISVSQYQQFIKLLNKEQRFWAWSSGFSKLKTPAVAGGSVT